MAERGGRVLVLTRDYDKTDVLLHVEWNCNIITVEAFTRGVAAAAPAVAIDYVPPGSGFISEDIGLTFSNTAGD